MKRPYPHFKFPHEIEIYVTRMSEQETSWYQVNKGSFCLTTSNYGWFPTEVLMGLIDRRYEDTNNLGAVISGNMGTASIAVTDKEKSISILLSAGYMVTDKA